MNTQKPQHAAFFYGSGYLKKSKGVLNSLVFKNGHAMMKTRKEKS